MDSKYHCVKQVGRLHHILLYPHISLLVSLQVIIRQINGSQYILNYDEISKLFCLSIFIYILGIASQFVITV